MPLNEHTKNEIIKTLPAERVFFDFAQKPEYTRDATEMTFLPDALFFAESEAEIITAVKLCRKTRIPLIVRGAGTGYSGGALATNGGLLVSIERLKSIKIDRINKTVTVEPGVITADIMEAAESVGLFYPPDPASYKESTIGGNVAENAGGLRCKKYGVTKDYLISLRGVDANGDLIEIDNRSPYGLADLLTGSEGTLLIFTEIRLRLIDLPQPGKTIQAAFKHAVDAAAVVSEVIVDGIVPCIMEFMDRDAIDSSNRYDPENRLEGGAAMLLFETDGPNADKEASAVMAICHKHSPHVLRIADNPDEKELLWKVRRNISEAVKHTARSKMSEDVCVLPSRLPELVAYVEELSRNFTIRINCFGHAGDGNLHVNFLGMTGNIKEEKEIEQAVKLLFSKTLELGGTLSGEHGIGITKKQFLANEFDRPTISFMKRLNDIFDSEGILNPGKIFI